PAIALVGHHRPLLVRDGRCAARARCRGGFFPKISSSDSERGGGRMVPGRVSLGEAPLSMIILHELEGYDRIREANLVIACRVPNSSEETVPFTGEVDTRRARRNELSHSNGVADQYYES